MKWFFIVLGVVISFAFGFVAKELSTEKEIAIIKEKHAEQVKYIEAQSIVAMQAAAQAESEKAEYELLATEKINLLLEEIDSYDETNCAKQPIPSNLLNAN